MQEIAKKPTENSGSACALFRPIRQAASSAGNVDSSWNGQLPGNLQQWPPRISLKQFQFARSHTALQVFTFFDGPKLLNIRTEMLTSIISARKVPNTSSLKSSLRHDRAKSCAVFPAIGVEGRFPRKRNEYWRSLIALPYRSGMMSRTKRPEEGAASCTRR